MIEYRLLPQFWSEEEAIYYHVENPDQEKAMWNQVRELEETEHCKVEVVMNGEKIL